ncbi:hypothetical protein N7462_009612 [Penicillium macrosclerotiorum]|uniref:uncharacterized protein n=1 Tax=Penicillium macrosclerotiorum TaxID=303699 RepID=UPI0025476CB7|nr:uncharacterized protein N7462_009612 [Penicillium macrosclerotiorum]KAJ5674173.1 hypothetical protein N7462_009612 [Penicillium macrosclerotiorum]
MENQKLDQKTFRKDYERVSNEKIEKLETKLTEAKAELQAAKMDRSKTQGEIHDLETLVQERSNKIKKNKAIKYLTKVTCGAPF